MTNCPNCGAPIKGPRCEYCETVFDEYSGCEEEIEEIEELVKRIHDYSRENETICRLIAQRKLELEAMLIDSRETFNWLGDVTIFVIVLFISLLVGGFLW